MNEEEARCVLALKLTPGIGDILAKQLISYCGAASAIFKEKKGMLLKIPNIGSKTVAAITTNKYLQQAESVISTCDKQKISVLPYYHNEYPTRLKVVNDAPLIVFKKGNLNINNFRAVSIVGTRNATNYGKHITEKIIHQLTSHKVVIVSGLAYGIDIAAHRAALKYKIPTVAILAGGLDRIYPAVHQTTAREMLEHGAWMSEYIPGIRPEAHNFPMRNRIIAGMSEALIVVEAASKGGALITANLAYSYNREVFAVPGALESKYSEGCNALIRSQKANILTSIKDLNYILGWKVDEQISNHSAKDYSSCSPSEQMIMAQLRESASGLHLDELSWKTQLSISETVSCLLNLEFEGLLRSLPGKKYVAV